MTVQDLRERMGQAEFTAWHRYLSVQQQHAELDRKRAGL